MANVTAIRTFSSVYGLMQLQIILQTERVITHFTGIRLVLTMYPLMLFQFSPYDKWATTHTYGRSPICKALCLFGEPFYFNVFLQTPQKYRRSSQLRICIFRRPSVVNDLLQTQHGYRSSLLCVCLWHLEAFFCLNDILHTSQENLSSK
jgi:hypothetical protein